MPEGFDRERWRLVSPYLDRALELTHEQRPQWLETLRATDATLATDVEALLREHSALQQEGFLESGAPSRPSQASLAGQVVGTYTLRSPIGEGGMGSVWLAERSDGRFQGVAAVKLLNASLLGAEGEGRFKREGSILARLQHPHIAHLIDAGVSPLGQPYLVLEHVDGERIDRYCDVRRLGIEARVQLLLDVLAAVAHAHANLIVHRDLKPSNVLVTNDGQVKLLDFGVAKLLAPEAGEALGLTREGEAALTPEYAAPEQLTGGHVTTATDVYAMGVLLYVVLTGRHPAGGDRSSPADLMRSIVETEPRRLSDAVPAPGVQDPETLLDSAARRGTTPGKLRARLRGDLDNIVAKALKKRPEERYPSVFALADDLRRFLADEPVSARADSLAYRTAKFVRRNRTAVQLAALALVLLAAGVAGTFTQARRARAQAALAEAQRMRADQEARAASEQRDFAFRQLSRAEAINDLNSFLLRDAAPLGKPFTVGELLARAQQIVERQPDDGNRVGMLVQIGRQYLLQDEDTKAKALLTQAEELARGSSDPATRAEAACALAWALAVGGEGPRAEQLVQQAEAQLPKQPQYAVHRISCLLSGNHVALELGDTRAAIERAQAAQTLLKESPFASPPLELRVLIRLADTYRLTGRYREADAAFKEAFQRLVSLGRDRTETAGELLVLWALAKRGLGRPLEAERLFRQVVQISSADGAEAHLSPTLISNLARVLRDLERLPEAAQYAQRAYENARRAGQEIAANQSLFVLASVYREQGALQRAGGALAELESRLERLLPPGDLQFASLALEQAHLAAARGDFSSALSGADHAVALAEANSNQPQYLRRMLRSRSEINLLAHRVDRAEADAAKAVGLELEAADPGTFSSYVGLAYLALVRALQAKGQRDEARSAFTSAVRHLGPTMGEQHPATQAAQRLAASAQTGGR